MANLLLNGRMLVASAGTILLTNSAALADGTPNFAMVRGPQMERHWCGIHGWTDKIWPVIQKETAEA